MIRPLSFLLAALAVSCADPPGPGERCIADADCEGNLGCYAVDATSSRRCLAPCDPAAVVFCTAESEGSLGLCAPIDGAATPGVCLVGGATATGGACGSSLECAESGICVVTGDAGVCGLACDTAAPTCPEGESCAALGVDGRRGQCVAAADGGL